MERKKYYLEKYDLWIDYDGTAEGLVDAIKNNEVVRADMEEIKLGRVVNEVKGDGWYSCYLEDTEGRRVKGGGGTESTGKAKSAKGLMQRREQRWPDWRD